MGTSSRLGILLAFVVTSIYGISTAVGAVPAAAACKASKCTQATATATPTTTPLPTATATPTAMPTATATLVPTATSTPTLTPTATTVSVPIDNASFESGTTGWNVWGSGYLSSVVDARATDGSHVLQVAPMTATDPTFGVAYGASDVSSPLPTVTLSADIALQQSLGLPYTVPTITVGIWNYVAGGAFYCSTTVTPNRDGSMQHVVLGPCAVPTNLALGFGFEENYAGPNDLTFIVDNVHMVAN